MLNQKINIVRQVRGHLLPTEDTLDETLGQFGKLLATTAAARLASGVSARDGADAINHLLAATSLVGQARERLLAAHGALLLHGRVQVPEIAWGDTRDCPPAEAIADAEPVTMVRAAA